MDIQYITHDNINDVTSNENLHLYLCQRGTTGSMKFPFDFNGWHTEVFIYIQEVCLV